MIKEKNKKNKGFTLIEMVLAIAVFAIAIVPILTTFVTSARINKNSRKMMAATDCAQSLLEAVTDKTYDEVQKSITNIATGVVSDYYFFSSVDNNIFNNKDNFISVSENLPDFSCVSINEAVFDGTVYSTSDLVALEELSESMNMAFRAQCFPQAFLIMTASPALEDRQRLFVHNEQNYTILYYYGIDWNGYLFNAVIDIIPSCDNTTDEYYTYYVRIALYDYKADNSYGDFILSLNGGIRNKRL